MPIAPPDTDTDLSLFRRHFPVFERSIYLNSCSLGPLAREVRAEINGYLDLWETRGAPAWYDTWLPALDRLRAGYAEVIGAAPGTIALHPSISSALTSVADSFDYRRRPVVVTTSLDFPTIAYQWLGRTAQGVEVRVVESPDGLSIPTELLLRAVDERTALVATSHVFFTTGAIQQLAPVAAHCRAVGARLLVDGYQAAGQIPVHVGDLGADFYCAGGLKWLLGGSGIAFLYSNPDTTGDLIPTATGWFAHSRPFDFATATLSLREDGRRYETGTPAMGSVYAQLAGLELLKRAGLARVQAETHRLSELLIEEALAAGLAPRVSGTATERSAIVPLARPDPHADVARLARAGIMADARPGLVRLSPYFYNTPSDHRAALEILAHV
ncbi:MAG TPA: aminotransferase class V-fold PLP-dependent enzyme [Gemmatimonadales bacterium]|nr:aminotransferase class V-fold PLP-dependent enzyme [Gemmatimonadales bacterium]